MSTPLLLVPLRIEELAVRRGARGSSISRFGMGRSAALASVARVRSSEPAGRGVVLLGVGGGLVEGGSPGDVVVANVLHSTDGEPPVTLEHAASVAAVLEESGVAATLAPVISSPKIISGPDRRSEAAATGAVAVDMESYWCAALADAHPFAVVRVLLDVPGHELFSPRIAGTLSRAWRALTAASRAVATWSPTTLGTENLLEVGDS